MNGDTTTMLATLHADSAEAEFIDLRRIHPDKPAVEEFIAAGDIEAAASWAIARRDAGDVYVGVLPRTRRAGGRDAVPGGDVVWADCDSPESVAALAEFPLEPSMVVMSGTGENRHSYWLLDERIDSARIEQLNRRVAAALGSDARVCDAARILRVPGTLNHKHDPPTEVTLASCPRTRYKVAALEAALGDDGDDAAAPVGVDKPPPAGDGPTEMVLRLLEDVRETGNGWIARCPAHDDERPSLSIAEGDDGRCVLHCFADCRPTRWCPRSA